MKKDVNKLLKNVKKKGSKRVLPQKVDLCQKSEIDAAVEVVKDFGNVDILINNAGIVTGKSMFNTPDALIEKTFKVNTLALFWTAKAFLPGMLARNSGHIVTVASCAGLVGVSGLADYCASKFGAVGFDESIRMEIKKLGKNGVKTTVICPYYINTGMFEGVKTRFPLLLTIMEPSYVIDRSMNAILTNTEVLILPYFCWWLGLTRALFPVFAFDGLMTLLGVNNNMDEFKGRIQSQKKK